ncbi:MAG TPA: hypothetical protein VF768_07165, partial [Holophagaceae bacterium]
AACLLGLGCGGSGGGSGSGSPQPGNPTIASFAANPSTLTAGQSSTLTWSVSGATSLNLGPGIGAVTGTTVTVSPTTTTTYTLTATNAAGSATASATVTVTPAAGSAAPQVLPQALQVAAQKSASSDPAVQAQWTAFLARLDASLHVVVPSEGIYQGSELEAIPDYALAYRVLRATDKVRAEQYADKALGLMKSALNDYQKGTWIAQQFLARGDGHTLTFTVPNADFDPATLQVTAGAVSTTAVVKGAANGQDDTGVSYAVFLKASRTSDGTPDYVMGTDWRFNGDYSESALDWSLGSANQPAPGATYYVTSATPISGPGILGYNAANPADTSQDVTVDTAAHTFTLHVGAGHTLAAAPGASVALFIQYSYGTHASDYSTLACQQTSMGDGGFNSAFIDTGYTSRYLGKNVALGYDWLYDYPGFGPALKRQAEVTLAKWYNYFRAHGYYYGSPSSNYGAGEYLSATLTALALRGRAPYLITDGSAPDQFDGATVMAPGTQTPLAPVADMLTYRTQNLLPILTGSISATQGLGSYQGGFWAEGWNYGQKAATELLLAGRALEEGGQIPAATEERAWATEALAMLLQGQPDPATLYDAGDWYAYPAPFVGKDLVTVLGFMSPDGVSRAYANHILQSYPGSPTSDFMDVCFRDPKATAADWTGTLPLQYQAAGTGLVLARADWSYASTWMAFQLGNLVAADHQTESPGVLQVSRGTDQLLINGNAPNEQQYPKCFSNTVMIDDNGTGYQTYRFNMGDWYHAGSFAFDPSNPASQGTPGCALQAYESAPDHVYAAGDYRAAFYSPAGKNPATELTRQVVYVRPDYVFVHDRAGTVNAAFPKLLRWHFPNAPTVSAPETANADGSGAIWTAPVVFSETTGASRLFGLAYGTAKGTAGILPLIAPDASRFGRISPLHLGDQDPCPFASCSDTAWVVSESPTPTTLTVQGGAGNRPVYALILANDASQAGAPANVRYTTTFQTASAATAAMDPCVPVISTDAALEGSRLGSW